MKPQEHKNTFETEPTSPWTESFQSAAGMAEPQFASARAHAAPMMADETFTPTHDALSDIYNWGIPV
ncbi:hypothetical protein FBR02_12900 [Anaerolineae bacterium CFX9]|jgi:hypothetical protein|nr:hypothetical protein [Geitlerinema splendidum]MDK3160619.1 hypothetical protein [Kamptonema cortianum]MDL1901658.1 hypothetical protein [Anaerolineae bacterium CFX9]